MRIRWVRALLAAVVIYGTEFYLVIMAFSALFAMSDDSHPIVFWVPFLFIGVMAAVAFVVGRLILPKQSDTPLLFEWSIVVVGIVLTHYAIFFEQVTNGAIINDLTKLIGMALTTSLIGILGSLSKRVKVHRPYTNQGLDAPQQTQGDHHGNHSQ